MTAPIVVIAGAGAIGFYAYSRLDDAPRPGPRAPIVAPKVISTAPGPISSRINRGLLRAVVVGGSVSRTSILATGGLGSQIDNAIDETRRNLEARAKAEYDKLSCDAKKAGAKALIKAYPTIKLDPEKACDNTYEQIAAAAGATIAGGACAVVPGIGTLASPLCAIAGAYLGVKVEKWVSEEWDDAKGAVGDAANAVAKGAKSVVHEILSWF